MFQRGPWDSCIGTEMADWDFQLELEEHAEYIEQDRKRRLREMAGKYIITQKGKSSGKLVFYQVPTFRRNHKDYWTQYKTNAWAFKSLNEAKGIIKKFKYNNPRIAIVDASGNYTFVK